MSDQIYLSDIQIQHHTTLLSTKVKLHYVTCGNIYSSRDNKVILFVHGWPDCWFGWRKQFSAMYQSGYSSIAIDLRGMGSSYVQGNNADTNKELYTFQQSNNDIIALLNHLGINKVILVGHDWGGAVVWPCARRYPWRIHAVGALCTPYRPRKKQFISIHKIAENNPAFVYQLYLGHNSEQAADELNNNVENLVKFIYRSSQKDDNMGVSMMKKGDRKLLQRVQNIDQLKRSPLLSENDYNSYVKIFKARNWRASLNYYSVDELNYYQDDNTTNNIEQHPTDKNYKIKTSVDIPSLMVTAANDRVLAPKMADNMQLWCDGGYKRVDIQNSSHWIQVEQSDKVNNTLIEWFETLPAIENNNRKQNSKL